MQNRTGRHKVDSVRAKSRLNQAKLNSRAAIARTQAADHHARNEMRPVSAVNSLYTTKNVETRVSLGQLVRYSESRAHGRR
ncbi:hypothetical protein Y032_0267g739 [Ancylostoma ceylanicum]|nr:hypothetical protein Y032_0267g739 [Ancylostoma ceylanicum]